MMVSQILMASVLAAAQAPPPETKTSEARIEELEREVERLKLQAPQPDEQPGGPPLPPPAAAGPNVFNPTLTLFGNGLYRYDDRAVLVDGERTDNTFNLREVEIDFRAAIDPFADGVIILAVPSEVPGQFSLAVEEAYINLKRLPLPGLDEPPLGLKLKVGRFRTEAGRINRLHLHDLPQMTRPLAVETFLGEEGYIANGISAQIFVPTPFDEASAIELSAQALAGGGAAVADGPARSPAFVGNLRWFRPFAGSHNVDLALIYLYGRTDPDGTLGAHTQSADFMYRWKPLRAGEYRSFLLGGQVFAAQRAFLEGLDTDGDGVPDTFERRDASPLGYFAWVQLQLARPAYLGARWDDTAAITDAAVRRRAITGYLTLYASEFLRFRVGYEHRFSDVVEDNGRDSVFAELNFLFGAHPPEPFWVNR
jgi:hypothetical protein